MAAADISLTLGYGRPLSNDRPSRPSTESLPNSVDSPFAATLIAQSELVQSIRPLVRWIARAKYDDVNPLDRLLISINDELDAWFFRWTSPASELSHFEGCSSFTLVLAHHVRLCLNMLPLQTHATAEVASYRSKSHRLALTSAVEIIDMFHRDFSSPVLPISSLRFAPGIAASILAHAALCLLPRPLPMHPGSPPSMTLASGAPNPIASSYFAIALDLLRGEQSNQGHFTPTFAKTISFLLGEQSMSRPDTPGRRVEHNIFR